MRILPAAAMAALLLASSASAAPLELAGDEDRLNYGIGWSVGNQMKEDRVPLRPDPLVQGVKDALAGTGRLLSDDQMRELFRSLQNRKAQAKADEAKAFLEENAKRGGVRTLPSGLQIKTLKEGDGPSPQPTDTVSVHYTGTLADGTEFDSSVRRGKPATFRLDQVIRGWTEGLQLMKVNGKALLFIPPDLGYGAKGAGERVPGNSALVFEVELLGITPR